MDTRDINDKLGKILDEVATEVQNAQENHAPLHSFHEGMSVIEEEIHELRMEVYKNPRKHPERKALARKEAIQVAAMAMRLIYDVCDE